MIELKQTTERNKMITVDNFTRMTNDINGNPRYVASWCAMGFSSYDKALTSCKKVGGKKFHNKQFGGGIIFVSYRLQDVCDNINNLPKW